MAFFLDEIEARVLLEEFEDASGVAIVATSESGYEAVFGPFPKDTALAMEAAQRLMQEGDFVDVSVRLLFPVEDCFPWRPNNLTEGAPDGPPVGFPNESGDAGRSESRPASSSKE